MYIHLHTYIHPSYACIYMYTHTYKRVRKHTYTHKQTNLPTYILTYMHTNTNIIIDVNKLIMPTTRLLIQTFYSTLLFFVLNVLVLTFHFFCFCFSGGQIIFFH
jgi:uncharacterized membrane protein